MKKVSLMLLGIIVMGMYNGFAQLRTISGEVTRVEDRKPVPGVSVRLKGTTLGTVTNVDGFYQLEIPMDGRTLVFSFVGMKTVEIPIEGSVVNAVLKPDNVGVDEVMVVAYGTSRTEQFTGSASTIDGSELEKFQSESVSRVLQGLAPGLMTTSGSGQPGEEAEIRIRGFNSFGEASPLIVLDGFPFDGPLNSIPTADIESLTILKDVSATALYGSRAASGVIIITTKKGRPGTAQLDLTVRYGFSGKAWPGYNKVSIPEYYELQWEGLKNTLIATGSIPEEAAMQASSQLISKLGGYNVYNVSDDHVVGSNGEINPQRQFLWTDNWRDELFVTGKRKEITLNARGGTEKTDYFLSGTLLDAGGIVKASDFRRYSVRANVNTRFNQWIRAGINLSGMLSEQNYPVSSGTSYLNPFLFADLVAPIYPVYLYNRDGLLQSDAEGNKLFDYGTGFGRSRMYGSNVNPLGTISLDKRLYKNDVFTLRAYSEFSVTEGLVLKTAVSTDYANHSALVHQNQKYGDGRNFNGRSSRNSNRMVSYTANEMIMYEKYFGNHRLEGLAAHENYSYKLNNLNATRTGFPFPGLFELDAAAVAEGSGSFEDNYRLESYLARFDYTYKDRYFLSLNARSDGNSRFAKDVRWGNYWGMGMAWLISGESFLAGLEEMNTLRLKVSYGQQGNDQVGSFYAYQGLYQTGMNNMDFSGLLASRLPTPALTWESLESVNLGAGVKMWDRFSLNIDYFIRNNSDLLFEKPLPPSTGFTSIDANIARLSNIGWELEMSGLLADQSKFSWNVDINLSHFKNKIRELPQDFIINGHNRWEEGHSIYDFWIQEYAGVDSESGKSLWFKDVIETDSGGNPLYDDKGLPLLTGERTKTSIYSDADRYYAGSSIPGLVGGITNSFRFSGFDFSVFMHFAVGGKVMDKGYQWLMHAGLYGYGWHSDIIDRWTPDNTNTAVPVIDGDPMANMRSSRFLAGAGYLNIRNVTFGYRLPSLVTSHLNISSARFYVTGDNLLLFSDRKGLNSQQSFDGAVEIQYDPLRNISMGLNVNF